MRFRFFAPDGTEGEPTASLFYYVASPYSGFYEARGEEGLQSAFAQAAFLTGKLLDSGLNCISPIVHGHPVSRIAKLDPLDHEFWMAMSLPLLERCDGLIVLPLQGWETSVGVGLEVEHAARREIPRWRVQIDGEPEAD